MRQGWRGFADKCRAVLGYLSTFVSTFPRESADKHRHVFEPQQVFRCDLYMRVRPSVSMKTKPGHVLIHIGRILLPPPIPGIVRCVLVYFAASHLCMNGSVGCPSVLPLPLMRVEFPVVLFSN